MKNIQRTIVILFILAVTLLSACSSAPSLTPTQKEISSKTPTGITEIASTSTPLISTCIPVSVVVSATPQPTPIATYTPTVHPVFAYTITSMGCKLEECLFINKTVSNLPAGLATIEGYYTKSDQPYMDGKTYSCDSFVVVKASFIMTGILNNLMVQKNWRVGNMQNHPVIIIDLKNQQLSDVAKIKATSLEKSITLRIMVETPLMMGQYEHCQTEFEILTVGVAKLK